MKKINLELVMSIIKITVLAFVIVAGALILNQTITHPEQISFGY